MFEDLRRKAGFTQKELALRLNVKQNTISNWENGKAKPDIITARKLSEILNVSTDEIVTCFEGQEVLECEVKDIV